MKFQDQYTHFAYYTNKLLENTKYIMVKNYRTMRKHFKIVGEKISEIGDFVNSKRNIDKYDMGKYV